MLILACTATASLAALAGQAGDPTDFSWTWPAGEPVIYRIGFEKSQYITGDPPQSGRTVSDFEVAFRSEGADAKGADNLRATYTGYKVLQQSSRMPPIGYDSWAEQADQPIDPRVKPYADCIGQVFNCVVTPKGNVTQVMGFDVIVDHLYKASLPETAEGEPPPEDAQLRASLEESFSNEAMRMMLNDVLAVLPGKALSEGESWIKTDSEHLTYMGDLQTDTTYTFEGMEGVGGVPCARFAITGIMSFDPISPDHPEAAGSSGYDISLGRSTVTGYVLFDMDARQVLDSRTEIVTNWSYVKQGEPGSIMAEKKFGHRVENIITLKRVEATELSSGSDN